tara:strand:- start:44 stop:241 length:198 start_codon:yes stop_codon:yes gene_type:complete
MKKRFNEKATGVIKQPICNLCEHYIAGEKCFAFDFIPDIILTGENGHKKPLDGQKNELIFNKKNV